MTRIGPDDALGPAAHRLRRIHNAVGITELSCLSYLWYSALSRRRGRLLIIAITVLTGEGVALVVARGCPLGGLQRKVGDDVPMFELWFGRRLAPAAIPVFTGIALLAVVLIVARPPRLADREKVRSATLHRAIEQRLWDRGADDQETACAVSTGRRTR